MNNLKFRIWDLNKKTWRNPYEFAIRLNTTDPAEQVLHAPMIFGGYGAAYGEYEINQWTGLKDRKGNDVYDGDIVCEQLGYDQIAEHGSGPNLGRVFFAAGTFMIDGDGTLYDRTYSLTPDILEDYLVVGNIYENKELLNK